MEKIFYTYNNIHNIIHNSIDSLKEYNPDVIVAIGGGGLIPARIIRSYIEKPIFVVTVSSYDDEIMKNDLKVIQWIDNNFKDQKVLLVDEIDDTGRTLSFCLSKLKQVNNANNICVFVVHNKDKIKFNNNKIINYVAGETIEDKWVVYPWDLAEKV